jgi:excisionase family DNA binding protein
MEDVMDDELLSIESAQKYLGGVSRAAIFLWLSQGKLRRTKVGSRTMIRRSELERVIHDQPEPELRTA